MIACLRALTGRAPNMAETDTPRLQYRDEESINVVLSSCYYTVHHKDIISFRFEEISQTYYTGV